MEAAAVTEEVSLMAVPAKIPNASPFVVEKPRSFPRSGKIIAAIKLKKNITDTDWATSSSLAFITGAAAAIAEPPQIEEPTPTSIAEFLSILNNLNPIYATIKAIEIVAIIIGNDCIPVFKITFKFKPKPRKTTAICKMYFDVKLMPFSKLSFFVHITEISIPEIIAIIGPPIMGKVLPIIKEGIAIIRQNIIPLI